MRSLGVGRGGDRGSSRRRRQAAVGDKQQREIVSRRKTEAGGVGDARQQD